MMRRDTSTTIAEMTMVPIRDKRSNQRLTHEQSIFSYFNISYDFFLYSKTSTTP